MEELKNGKAEAVASFLPVLKVSGDFFCIRHVWSSGGVVSCSVFVREKTTIIAADGL